jgi:ABC-type phosphate/phosphonate transport system substrate-binding protein
MYDFPELRDAHDRLWAAMAQRLHAAGVADVPAELTRGVSHREIWTHPRLLFAQACEYPVAKSFRECLRIVATPRYGAPGCVDACYRSAILVRATDFTESLAGLRGRRCAVNESDSNSGMNLFRAALAPVAAGARFFASVLFTGSHRRSVELLVREEADVTAIDCVTFAHLRRFHPSLVSKVRVIDWTPGSPCLPFVTSRLTDDPTLEALRAAIEGVFADESLARVRKLLLLEGVQLEPDASLARVQELELQAKRWRYPVLA